MCRWYGDLPTSGTVSARAGAGRRRAPGGWALTIGVIVALLAFDLLLATVRSHAVGYREATAWSAFYIVAAVVFGLVFASLVRWGFGAEYFAGYIVEKSLSVDNLFVFVIIMATFAVPREHQQRVLIFRDHRRPGPASGLHRAGGGPAVAAVLHVPDLRAAAALDGRAAVPPP